MVEFGDEIIIESYRIPWLIWIQLLVTTLLIVLLFFGFSIFTSDSPTSSSSGRAAAAPPTHLNNPSSSNRMIEFQRQWELLTISMALTKVEGQRATRDAGTSGGSIREEDQSGDEPTLKDSMFLSIFRRPHHPCNYIGLAKRALFKCFGMDASSESSSNHQHEKQE